MYYSISNLCPRKDHCLGGHGFWIHLHPKWKNLIVESKITEENIQNGINNSAREWLDACGYGEMFDPDNCGFGADKKKPPGPKSYPMYSAHDVRVSWGKWGMEHITVPGNACGLDINRDGLGCPYRNGVSLCPHNVDHWGQVQLLLVVFTWFADLIVSSAEYEAMKSETPKKSDSKI